MTVRVKAILIITGALAALTVIGFGTGMLFTRDGKVAVKDCGCGRGWAPSFGCKRLVD
jgi:hypothetical protein